jgi:hypothetical protein
MLGRLVNRSLTSVFAATLPAIVLSGCVSLCGVPGSNCQGFGALERWFDFRDDGSDDDDAMHPTSQERAP